MSVMTRDEALAQLTAEGAAYEITSGLVNGRPSRYFKTAPLTLGDLFKATASDLPFTFTRKSGRPSPQSMQEFGACHVSSTNARLPKGIALRLPRAITLTGSLPTWRSPPWVPSQLR